MSCHERKFPKPIKPFHGFNNHSTMKPFSLIPISAIFLLFMLFFISCNKETTNQVVDCSQCFAVAPDSGYLALHVTINPDHVKVPVTIYLGNLEDHDIKFRDTVSQSTVKILMPAGHAYAVAATYIQQNDTIVSVDGTSLEVKKAVGQCSKSCYTVIGGYLDLRLR